MLVTKKIRLVALCAISGLCACLNAASIPVGKNPEPPLAVYYSFEALPPGALFSEMQLELARILAPAKLRVAWRAVDGPGAGSESFREVVVMRFRGACAFEKIASIPGSDHGGMSLAETELSDGRVLPFGEVQCNELKHYLAPASGKLDEETGNAALGRAMARVVAHEIYHMLTGSGNHALTGIARAAHSRAELTAATFDFGRTETDWLRGWVKNDHEATAVAVAGPSTGPTVTGLSSGFLSSGAR